MPQSSQFTPPMHPDDELIFQSSYDTRDRTQSPPLFYSAYPPPEEMMIPASYGTAAPSYRPMTTESYGDWTTGAVPVTLPSMTHFSDAIKRESAYPGEDAMAPYMNYGYMPGMDINAPTPYDNSNPHVSSLRHHHSHPAPAAPTPVSFRPRETARK